MIYAKKTAEIKLKGRLNMEYLSVALVDDEEIVLEDLETLIDWKKCGFDPVYKAHNAKQGLELAMNNNIDILFLDIMLPGMDGLELASRIRAFNSRTQIVILSSYREFSYATRAIEADVFKYMLKHELTAERLTETLGKMRAKIQESDVQRIAMMQSLLHGIAFRGEDITPTAQKELSSLRDPFRLAALTLDEKSHTESGKSGKPQLSISFIRGMTSGSLTVTNVLAVSDRILIFAASKDRADAEDTVNFINLLEKILAALEENGTGKFTAIYEEECVKLEQLHEVNDRMTEAIKNASSLGAGCFTVKEAVEGDNQSYTPSTRFIIQYVKEHFTENIALSQIAEEIHGNSMYIGQCFIKDVGVSFRNYLNSFRIDKAKKLLATTNDRVFEISEQVGILNSQYFSKIFREETGQTPNEYRDHNYHAQKTS